MDSFYRAHLVHDDSHLTLHLQDMHLLDRVPLQRLVLMEGSWTWMLWNKLVIMALMYTASVTPYRLCFVVFRVGGAWSEDNNLLVVDGIVDVVFWLDLVMGFFVSFTTDDGERVIALHRIAIRYAMGMFWLNLLACLPVELLSDLFGDRQQASAVKAIRLIRLQRAMKLIRVIRTSARMIKLGITWRKSGRLASFIFMHFSRTMSFMGKVAAFCMSVHFCACSWYLAASFSPDDSHTWVHSKGIEDMAPAVHYLYSIYFVVTVFTTVGFGDISANTTWEMTCVIILMIIGILVNSYLLSQIVDYVQQDNQLSIQKGRHKHLIDALSDHTEMDEQIPHAVRNWIDNQQRVEHASQDIEHLQQMLLGGAFPQDLMQRMSESIFQGRLRINVFVISGTGTRDPPPSLPVMLAMASNKRHYKHGEFVYEQCDAAWGVFLVLSGTYAELFCAHTPVSDGLLGSALGSSMKVPVLSMQSSVATEDYAMAASTSDLATQPGFTSMRGIHAEALEAQNIDVAEELGAAATKLGTTVKDTLQRSGTDVMIYTDATRNRFVRRFTRVVDTLQKRLGQDAPKDGRIWNESPRRISTRTPTLDESEPSEPEIDLDGVHLMHLWSDRNYFGSVETIHTRRRITSVRCEQEGSLLVLSKERLNKISADNPDMKKRWQLAAARRLHRTKEIINEISSGQIAIQSRDLGRGGDFLSYAAITIQRFWVRYLQNIKAGQTSEAMRATIRTGLCHAASLLDVTLAANQSADYPATSPNNTGSGRIVMVESRLANLERDTSERFSGLERGLLLIGAALNIPEEKMKLATSPPSIPSELRKLPSQQSEMSQVAI